MTNVERTEKTNEWIRQNDGRVWVDIVESFVDDNGVVFSRSGYTINGETSADINERHFTANPDDVIPAVRCGKCRRDAFRITFGSYECIAVCVACGMAAVVYDG